MCSDTSHSSAELAGSGGTKGIHLVVEARRLAQAGETQDAIRRVELFIKINEDPIARSDGMYELALIRHGIRDYPGAATQLRELINSTPDHLQARVSLGKLLSRDTAHLEEAIVHLEHACRLAPDDPSHLVDLLFARRRCCMWGGTTNDDQIIGRLAAIDPALVPPFPGLMIGLTPAAQKRSAERAAAASTPRAGAIACPPLLRPLEGRRLRLGYLSSDFREHPVAHLVVRILELHDRAKVEVFGLSISADDLSPMRQRILVAVDRMIDLEALDDQKAAALIHELELDILIDLNGHTSGGRPGILASRPAPVQVAWLGYPGTTGASWIDYAIVDPFTAPYGVEPEFSEALVRLACYQSNDDQRQIDQAGPGPRSAHGLPDAAVVFACFNQPVKITPAVFASWMRILQRVPGSVLWLLDMGGPAARHLGMAATAAGVAADRVVFAPIQPHDRHLSRVAHADLVLDTRPYNAHTTASDALWMGVPVITWPDDQCFQGRVAASLLTNVGLEELIATDEAAYEQLAIALAADSQRRANYKAYLLGIGRRSRLFDPATHAHELEAAFERMLQRALRGQAPVPFDAF